VTDHDQFVHSSAGPDLQAIKQHLSTATSGSDMIKRTVYHFFQDPFHVFCFFQDPSRLGLLDALRFEALP
jgi:hypothetical protein